MANNNNHELIVLDFAGATVTTYTLDKSEREDVERFIEQDTYHRLPDIEYMHGDNIEHIDGSFARNS